MFLFNKSSGIKYLAKRAVEFLTRYAIRYHVPPRENKGPLFTFDDGPLPSTLGILDILDEYKEKAVFFLVAENVQKYPQIAAEIARRGHSIGSHGFRHINMKKLSLSEFSRQIKESFDIVEKTCKIKTRYFRPPFGQISLIQAIWLLMRGTIVFFWSCGVSQSGEIDFINPGIEKNKKLYLNKNPLIVLLHDYMQPDIIRAGLKKLK